MRHADRISSCKTKEAEREELEGNAGTDKDANRS